MPDTQLNGVKRDEESNAVNRLFSRLHTTPTHHLSSISLFAYYF